MSPANIVVGIDASNLLRGGGVTHLREMLRVANPLKIGIDKVLIFGAKSTLDQLEDRNWLHKYHVAPLARGNLSRMLWRLFCLRREVARIGCDVLFVPGGSDTSGFRPFVTMSRNLLPFMPREIMRYGATPMTLKLMMLRWMQTASMARADGVIFLTKFAVRHVSHVGRLNFRSHKVIPHGVSTAFNGIQRPIREHFTPEEPCRVIYVSTIDAYKNQVCVIDAIALLRTRGIPVTLTLIGDAYPRSLRVLKKRLKGRAESEYIGPVAHAELPEFLAHSDINVFASSCENMPNILLEGMAAGLPTVCSRVGPMPEVLGGAGLLVNPRDPVEIAGAIERLIENPDLRRSLATRARKRAAEFTWKKCADRTFTYLAQVARQAEGR